LFIPKKLLFLFLQNPQLATKMIEISHENTLALLSLGKVGSFHPRFSVPTKNQVSGSKGLQNGKNKVRWDSCLANGLKCKVKRMLISLP